MARSQNRFSSTVPYELKDGDFVSYIEALHQLALQKRLEGKPMPLTCSYESPQDSFAKIRSQHQKTMHALHQSAQQHQSAKPSPNTSTSFSAAPSPNIQAAPRPSAFSPRTSVQGAPNLKGAPNLSRTQRPLSSNERQQVQQQLRKLNSLQGASFVFGTVAFLLLVLEDLYFPGNLIFTLVFIFGLVGFIYSTVKSKSLRSQL